MTTEEVIEAINQDTTKTFADITNKLASREDVHAFMLLDRLVPDGSEDLIAAAEHDEIYLSVHPEQLAQAGITAEQAEELNICGIFYTDDQNCLMMFR